MCTVRALYLVWLGIGMLRSGDDFATLPGAASGVPAKSVPRALVDSFIVELLNPKVALFFIAFLPQFVDPAGSLPVWAQFLILGVIVNVAFSSADLIAVLFTSALAGRLKRSGPALRIARRVGGALLIGLGARLALDRS